VRWRDYGVTMVTGGEWRVVGPRLHGSGLLRAVKSDASRAELQADLKLRDLKSFFERYLKPSLALGLLKMSIQDKPNSRPQKYRLMGKGCQVNLCDNPKCKKIYES
jgi:hypothetical protein